MSKHLPKSKMLQVFEGFCNLDFFLWFLITKFQGLKYFILQFTQSACVVREDGGFGFGGRSDRNFLSIEDLLRTRGAEGWSGLVSGLAIFGIMPNLPTFEALAFPHTFCLFLWGEFLQLHKVYFHGVRVSGSSGGGRGLGLEVVVTSSTAELWKA